MNQKRLLIILAAAILVGLYFPVNTFLLKRDITRLTEVILRNWETNNLLANFIYWKDPDDSPPIYGLTSHKIIKVVPLKNKSVEVTLKLNFTADNILPSGKDWIVEFKKIPRLGWLVIDFRQIN